MKVINSKYLKFIAIFIIILVSFGYLAGLFSNKNSIVSADQTTLVGNLEIYHEDNFQNLEGVKDEYYLLTDSGVKYHLDPTNATELAPFSRVEVTGTLLEGKIIGEITTLERNQPFTDPGTQVEFHFPYDILVLMVNPEGATVPFTKSDAESKIFNGQVQNFFKENSYNRRYLAGDVYGWIEMPGIADIASCKDVEMYDLADYISSNNIPLENYEHVLLLLNCGVNDGASTVGKISWSLNGNPYSFSRSKVSVGPSIFDPYAYSVFLPPFQWQNFDQLVTHELGHGFGLRHGNGYDCGDVAIGTNCQHIEYGNAFDAMGTGRGHAFHFNSVYKKILGWIRPFEALNVITSGTYTITPLESYGGIKLITINNPAFPTSNITYAVEARKSVGFDSSIGFYPELIQNQDGILIQRYADPSTPEGSRLIDASPTESEWYIDIKNAALTGQNVFHDNDLGITIGPIISSTPSGVMFNVTID